jgi:hypothetical protein
VISVSSTRVARHGVQNADENCTSVIRDPKSVPMSCDEIAEELTRDFLDFTFPWLRLYQSPYAVASVKTMRIGR